MDASAVIARSMTERDLSQHVVNLARMLGWRVARWPTWRATGTDPGVPDLVMVHEARRRVLFAELKRHNGRLTPDQETWHNAVNMAGVPCYVWRPLDHLDGTIERVLRGEE